MCIVDINIARIHDSHDVTTWRGNDKVADAVVKTTNIKELCKCADIDKSYNAILA